MLLQSSMSLQLSCLAYLTCIYNNCVRRGCCLCRFGFFCGAANEYLRVRNVQPDILHCHDWQSATVSWGERPNNAKVAFTIHNLNYGADLVGRAMATCEVATTVSPTYAREVC
jgi:starch synthase